MAWATTNWGWRYLKPATGKERRLSSRPPRRARPRWADAHFSLAAVYARIDRVPEAMTELDTTLGLSPDHYRANLLRGRILSLQGNPLGALDNLEKATQVQPDSSEAHLFLADAYQQLGRVSRCGTGARRSPKLAVPSRDHVGTAPHAIPARKNG